MSLGSSWYGTQCPCLWITPIAFKRLRDQHRVRRTSFQVLHTGLGREKPLVLCPLICLADQGALVVEVEISTFETSKPIFSSLNCWSMVTVCLYKQEILSKQAQGWCFDVKLVAICSDFKTYLLRHLLEIPKN